MRNKKGFSLAELLVSGTIGAIFMIALGYWINRSSKFEKQAFESTNFYTGVLGFINHLQKTARLARNCDKMLIASPAGVALECNMDFSTPPAGILTRVRFLNENNSETVLYQQYDSTVSQWNTQITYGSTDFKITEFLLCGHTEMTSGSADCFSQFQPERLSQRYQANVLTHPSLAQRYYRYRIGAQNPRGGPVYYFQSSVFVRNPTSLPTGFYQWSARY